jgi:large subunit ribosomal protein L32
MPTPKYRKSSSKRDMRRAHDFLVAPALSYCKSCGEVKQPHTVCNQCGSYKGAKVINVKQAQTAWDGSGADFSVD